jgi:uncharacterized protein
MIPRQAEHSLRVLTQHFKVVAVVGPRQSGKTTLVKKLFSDKTYVSFENLDTRSFATEDPRGFLLNYPKGAIFDEIQNVASIFTYLQEIVDNSPQKGHFIITGSNNLTLQQNITQS